MPDIEEVARRPYVVRVLLWDGTNSDQVERFVGAGNWRPALQTRPAQVWNSEERQWINVPVGHRLVAGRVGEFYPLSPDALAAGFDRPVDLSGLPSEDRELIDLLRRLIDDLQPLLDSAPLLQALAGRDRNLLDEFTGALLAFAEPATDVESTWIARRHRLLALRGQVRAAAAAWSVDQAAAATITDRTGTDA